MASRNVEIIVGIFVALGLGALFVLAMQVSNLSALQRGEGYEVNAYFDNVGGEILEHQFDDIGACLASHPAVDGEQPLIVNFNDYGASSLDIMLYCLVTEKPSEDDGAPAGAAQEGEGEARAEAPAARRREGDEGGESGAGDLHRSAIR